MPETESTGHACGLVRRAYKMGARFVEVGSKETPDYGITEFI